MVRVLVPRHPRSRPSRPPGVGTVRTAPPGCDSNPSTRSVEGRRVVGRSMRTDDSARHRSGAARSSRPTAIPAAPASKPPPTASPRAVKQDAPLRPRLAWPMSSLSGARQFALAARGGESPPDSGRTGRPHTGASPSGPKPGAAPVVAMTCLDGTSCTELYRFASTPLNEVAFRARIPC